MGAVRLSECLAVVHGFGNVWVARGLARMLTAHALAGWLRRRRRRAERVGASRRPFSQSFSSTFTHVDVILILLNYNLLRIISMYRHRLGPRTPPYVAVRRRTSTS